MPYCEPGDVRALNQLFTPQDFDDAYIQQFIDKAVARLNNRIQPHYVVPLADPVPPIINSIAGDMAAALMCQTHFSGVNYKEDTPLAEIYRKRAESDLEFMLDNSTLDEFTNVIKRQPDVPEMRKKIASTTPHPNVRLKSRMKQFDSATQSSLSNVREWP